ncbi:uncharacterized protein [Rutidosis leptorrhynchoides]|uniref:uncharacterized protein n=1 Tax=Rutidosis leptorrhynchoides TaxID=125765 RepID=UPI003A9953D3
MPRGILEDVVVKVEDFHYPVDFVVMDIESRNRDAQPTIILGRPFLATINAHINCRTGAMDISIGNRKMRINIFNSLHAPCVHECYQVDVIDEQVEKHTSHLITNDLVEVFCLGDEEDVECEEVKVVELAIASTMDARLPPWTHKYEPLPKSINTNTRPSLESQPTLELKPLPSHLRKKALMEVLHKYKAAVGWTIADMKGISPSVCMHRIVTDPEVKPARDTQRRLSPNMKEVVKKEVLKCAKESWDHGHGNRGRRKDHNPSRDGLADAPFDFDDQCKEAFSTLKRKLTEALILQSPDWTKPFEIMCDASDYAAGAVLGQRVDRKPIVIYYASKTFSKAQVNYTTTEKELLAVVFAIDKFRSYLWGSKVPWFTHSINYLVTNKVPEHWNKHKRDYFLSQVKHYIWKDLVLYRIGPD